LFSFYYSHHAPVSDSSGSTNTAAPEESNNTSGFRPISCFIAMDHAMDDMEALLGMETMRQVYGATDVIEHLNRPLAST